MQPNALNPARCNNDDHGLFYRPETARTTEQEGKIGQLAEKNSKAGHNA
jgi:hypothetical protein